MASAEELFCSNDKSLWKATLACYSKVLGLKAEEKKKSKRKGESLIQLDKWYQETLPGLISSREEPHMTHAELCKLMTWKLTRGKFRPRLTELVQQNTPAEVEDVSREAIGMLPDLRAAVKHLSQLKAVGPATASAVLCAASPELAPFMADEAVLGVPGLGKIEYTLKHYLAYAAKVQQKAKQLNRLDDDSTWTCHDVEKALWTDHLARKLGVAISLADSRDKEEEVPVAKRRKTDKLTT